MENSDAALRYIIQEIDGAIATMQSVRADTAMVKQLAEIAEICTRAIHAGGKILFMGNGGSAADSQHLAAELVSKLSFDRPGLPALALTTDTSALTAIGNDYGYINVFARQIEAIAQKGDVVFAISTSGQSPNILKGVEAAKARGVVTVGLTGNRLNTALEQACEYVVRVPSPLTPKIQECHIMMGHIICGLIEEKIFGALKPTAAAS